MGGKFGVKESKDLFDLGFGLAQAGKDVMEDGKVNLADLAAVIPLFPKIAPAVEGVDVVPSELAELDEADEVELLNYAKVKLPVVISDEVLRHKVYTYVRAGLAVAAAIAVSRS